MASSQADEDDDSDHLLGDQLPQCEKDVFTMAATPTLLVREFPRGSGLRGAVRCVGIAGVAGG
jgi:hypothetical protein